MSNSEGAPIIEPPSEIGSSSSGEKSDKKKSKKRLGDFGALMVESEPTPKRSSLMEYLTRAKEKTEESSKDEKTEGFFSIPKQREADEKTKKDEEPESFWLEKKEPGQKEETEELIPEDVEEVGEDEAPTEDISPEETRDIQKVFADEAPSEVEKLSSDAPEEEKVAAAAVDRLHEKMVVEDADLETAYQEVRSELGLPVEAPEEPFAETVPEAEPESFELQEEAEAQIETDETPQALVENAGDTQQEEAPESAQENQEEEEDQAATATPAPGAGGGTTPPPTGPQRTPGFGMPIPIPGQRAPANANLAPAAVAPNTYTPQYHESSPAAMALFGGIVGYLIGRRRGRIRAEKKLLPVQKKLRQQVESLEWELREREDRLRRAAEKAVKSGSVISGGLFATGRYNTLREQRRGKNAEQLHAVPKAPEHIGRMLMNAGGAEQAQQLERAPKNDVEKRPESVKHIEQQAETLSGKRVETLSRAELLALSETITVEGSSLRQIFETHLISEKGLRRLVAEHLRGGNVSQELRREIVEHEIDFERDPGLRDIKVPNDAPSGGGATQGKAALEKMFERAAANMPINNESVVNAQADALMQAEQAKKVKSKQRIIDFTVIGIITALITVVVVLYLARR